MIVKTNRIAFQGEFGANSDMAARDVFPQPLAAALRDLRRCLRRRRER